MSDNNKKKSKSGEPDPRERIYLLQPDVTNSDMPNVTHVQTFKMARVHRSQLKNAPYNPRIMEDAAKEKLRANLMRIGLTHPIEWNVKSKHIVGGHMRISQIDSIMGTSDYWLDVAVLELDHQAEVEQNVFLNNPETQGDWDLEKLGALFKVEKISIERSGFSTSQIAQMFGENILSTQTPDEITAIADRLRATWAQYEGTGTASNDPMVDPDFYLVFIFPSSVERLAFTEAMGLEDNCYQDGATLNMLASSQMAEHQTKLAAAAVAGNNTSGPRLIKLDDHDSDDEGNGLPV